MDNVWLDKNKCKHSSASPNVICVCKYQFKKKSKKNLIIISLIISTYLN